MSGDLRFHLDRLKQLDAEADAARTRYVVRCGLVYVIGNKHFTDDINDARRFDSMTAANAYAITMLDDYNFEVEAV